MRDNHELPPEARDWVAAKIAELEEAGVTVRFVDGEHADCGGSKVGGYFDEHGLEFVVATGKDPHLWLSVFLHEYCHWRQSQADTPAWMARLAGECCPQQAFDAWLAGVVEMTPEQLQAAVGLVLASEIECEQMAVAMLDRHPELGLDRHWYIASANVYLGWYGVVMKTRRWYDRSPYASTELLTLVPGKRLLNVDEVIGGDPHFEAVVMRTCYVDPAAV